MARFDGKFALVTGGGKGIGATVVRRLVSEGATVMAVDRSGQAQALEKECDGKVIAARCDVSDRTQVERLFATCAERFGHLDALFNNAGIGRVNGRLHELPVENWDAVMGTNLFGAFYVLQFALPLLLKSGKGGAVVNTGSISGMHPLAGTGAYPVSKACLAMLTRVTALEYAKDNIRVNCIGPGTVMTELTRSVDSAHMAKIFEIIPMGRAAEESEIAALTCLLLSDEARYITGAYYPIAGGREAT